jgi:hypothetical protein
VLVFCYIWKFKTRGTVLAADTAGGVLIGMNATSVGAVDYLLRQFLNKIDTTCLRLPIVGTRMRQAGWEQDWERHQDGCREESGNKNLGLNMVFEKALVGLIVKDLYSINIAALSSKD